ncbi:MAG: hypothetical protein V1702_05070 [Candidatus Woesearchaeota archaeon]
MSEVKKDFSPFKPGDKSRICVPENMPGFEIPPLEKLVDKTVIVSHPSRVHATVLDILQFSPANPAGGAIALSVDDYPTLCEAKVKEGEGIFFGRDYHPESDHIARVFCEAVGYKGGLSLNIHSDVQNHQGKGSTSALMASTAVALNELFNRPISQYNLRKLIGMNYVETARKNEKEICFGLTTGSGVAAGFYGGIPVICDGIDIADIAQPPEDYRIMCFSPKLPCPKRDHPLRKNEEAAQDNTRFTDDQIISEKKLSDAKCKTVLMDFIPAMRKNDFKAMGEAMKKLNEYFLVPQVFKVFYPDSIQQLSGILSKLGSFKSVDISGMSSMGPTMYATGFKSDLENLAGHLDEYIQVEPETLRIFGFSKGMRIWKNGEQYRLKYQRFAEG